MRFKRRTFLGMLTGAMATGRAALEQTGQALSDVGVRTIGGPAELEVEPDLYEGRDKPLPEAFSLLPDVHKRRIIRDARSVTRLSADIAGMRSWSLGYKLYAQANANERKVDAQWTREAVERALQKATGMRVPYWGDW